MIKIFNDVLLAVDKGQEVVVVLLDFSAAFNSIDHTTMTDRFQRCYGIKGTVHISGLSHTYSTIVNNAVVNGSLSKPFLLPRGGGGPQWSVVGPLEYILYTGPSLCEICSAHPDIQYAMYADDPIIYNYESQ